eukprot:CAMPEP_0115887832 /NCGR_PEP_ID=MMETSP0287-20121206/31981_1 /TAXON_ID=412157 /ORGANISM="Chrysochromulina rotalis, Strain UIO044" /LENGTH=144 /DNA_ID=CAMNT_0003344469 /DNA_START=268 /DNA_END=699 /DNA_ORIENTATION=-
MASSWHSHGPMGLMQVRNHHLQWPSASEMLAPPCRPPGLVAPECGRLGLSPHDEMQVATSHQILMTHRRAPEPHTVPIRSLHVQLLLALALDSHTQHAPCRAVADGELRGVDQGPAELVGAATRIDRVEAKRREHVPSTLLPDV